MSRLQMLPRFDSVNSYLQGSVVQRWENEARGWRGWRASVSGDGEGRSICSAQNWAMAKQCGEMHPARASVLMRSTLPLHSPAFTTPASPTLIAF